LSTSEEILQALQQVGGTVGQSLAAANAAKAKSEQAIQQSVALGNRDAIAQYSALKNAIEELIATLNQTRERAAQVMARARAAAG
jgi:hypothetical protein